MRGTRTHHNEIVVALFVTFRVWLGVRDALVATRWSQWTAQQWPDQWN